MAENPTPNPNESFSKEFNDRITKQILDPFNFVTSKSVFDYRSDSVRNDRYKAVEGQDDEFMRYIKKIYGDYETIGIRTTIVSDYCVVGLYLWDELFLLSWIHWQRPDANDTTENHSGDGANWS
jgi:hypothetical protein